MKKFLYFIFSLAICISTVLTGKTVIEQCCSGGFSGTLGKISPEVEDLILATFMDVDTPAELLLEVSEFACENFVYDDSAEPILQLLDMADFIFDQDFHGVCYDFTGFVKVVFNVISQQKGWKDVRCYGILVKEKKGDRIGHAYNYITFPGKEGEVVLCYDATRDVALRREGKSFSPFVSGYISEVRVGLRELARHAKWNYQVVGGFF